jgi:hypothetical protein
MQNLKRIETLSDDLADAAEAGNLEWLKSTLAAGVDVDSTNRFGTTALMRASARGDVGMVRFLLSYGADPNRVRNDKFTALALAAFFGRQNVVKCLVEHGADTNASTRFGTSPEMWAKARTFRTVAQYLGDKETARTRIPVTVAVDVSSAKQDEHARLQRSSTSLRLRLRVALSSVVLIVGCAVAEVVIEHRQSAPPAINEMTPANTKTIPVQTTVEPTVTEASVQSVNAAVNLDHSEGSGKRNTAAKPHSHVAQSRGQQNDSAEGSVTIIDEAKVKTEPAPREAPPTPVKVIVSRPVSAKPAAITSQLISSPSSEKTKSKVIQWP